MPYEFDAGRPIYLQLVELLTQAIVSGEFSPGQKLPGVRELALQYGVNPNTAQRTMAELERQGLAYSERTAGRFVTTDQSQIKAVRRMAALKQTADYLQNMVKLGITKDEIQNLLAEAAEKMEGEHND